MSMEFIHVTLKCILVVDRFLVLGGNWLNMFILVEYVTFLYSVKLVIGL